MAIDTRVAAIQRVMMRYQAGQMNRRQVVKALSGLGLATTGLALFGRAATKAGSGAGQTASSQAKFQEGAPPPAATPVLGQRADGTTVWRVLAGGMDMAALLEVNAFLPGEITINAGDSVFFDFGMGGFHNVAFRSGGESLPLFVPDETAGTPAAGGPPKLLFNPAIAFPTSPTGGDTYAGTGDLNSGVSFFRDPAVPFAPTFTTPGTYEYRCEIHPGMVAKITVQEAGSELPMDQAAIDQMAAEQLADYLARGQALIEQYSQPQATPVAGGATVHEVAAGASDGQVEPLRFMPAEISIKAGDTVRWTNHSQISPHTVTFLGGEEPVEDIIPEPQPAGPPKFVLNPVSFFPSQKPAAYNGQGLVNSGYIGQAPVFNGAQFELTFDTPGEYRYYCILHAGGPDDPIGESMVGRITVS